MTTNPTITASASAAIASMRTVDAKCFESATTVVPHGAVMDGTMSATENLAVRIDGEFKGTLALLKESAIHIGPNAVLDCMSLQADIIYIQGTFKGELVARKALELAPTARVSGTIRYEDRLDVHCGARLSGSIEGPQRD